MAKISTYPIVSIPTFDDLLIGTDMEDLKATKNFSIGDIANLIIYGSYVPYSGALFDVDLGIHKISASAFELPGGLSTQFLKADGSLDSTVYVPETRELTINGETYDLSDDREWTLPTIDIFSTVGTGGAATYVGGQLNIPVYQSQGDYITQLTGEASATGPGSVAITLNNDAVTGKVLTGLNITGGTILSTDTILQAFGKVQNQINGLFGGVVYQGTWNAATNTPNLQSSVGTKGYYYVVNVPGNTNLNGNTDWKVGDWVIFNGSTWDKVDNTDAVVSVNGYTGAVVLNYADVGAPPATRTLTINGIGQDLSADRSWTVGDVRTDGSYADPSWITTLNWSKIIGRPTTLAGYGITDAVPSSRTLTINGTSFDLSANRSWNVGTITQINTSGPITGGPITASGTIGITQAGVSSDGYLSSTDWNTFNNKQGALTPVAPIYITGSNIGITQSGAASDGYLSSVDWNIFNNKQDALTNPVTGTGTPYILPMWSGATTLTDSTLSYSSSAYTFSFNTATSASISMLNTYAAVDYSYTIVIAEGAPRSTTHVYSDGDIVQQIGASQVSRMASNGTFLLNSLAGTGTRMVVVDGSGVLSSQAIPSLTGYVPYTGATQNVNLGEYGLTTGFITLDTTPTGTPGTQGTIYWDDSRSTAALIMNGTIQHIGQDQFYYVKNSSGSTITKGTAVRFAGTDGGSGHLLIAPFLANGTFSSTYFMGVVAEDIPNGGFGQVMSFGELKGVNTNAFNDGDILYASTSVAGGYQTTVPIAPNNIISVAAVVNASNNGTIAVRPTLGSNINNDEGVRIVSPANGQVLQYNSTSGLWQNVAPSALAVKNIYSADGTLTGNRTVTSGGFSLTFTGSNTASSGVARGLNLTHTLTASANNDVLVGLDINPTFTNGAFTTVRNIGLRVQSGRVAIGSDYGSDFPPTLLVRSNTALFATQPAHNGIWVGQDNSSNAAIISIFNNVFPNLVQIGHTGSAYSGLANTGFIHSNRNFIITQSASGAVDATAVTMAMHHSTRNVSIGSNLDAGFRLDVNGTMRASQITLTGSSSVAAFINNGTAIRGSTNGATIYIDAGLDLTGTIQLRGTTVTAPAFTASSVSTIGNVNAGAPASGTGFSVNSNIVLSIKSDNTVLRFNDNSQYVNVGMRGNGYQVSDAVTPIAMTFNNSSLFELNSTTRGFLLPRMTTTQRNAIASPATGLMVYDTTDNEFDYFNGTAWTPIRNTNIYGIDGTLTGNRTLTLSSSSLTISGTTSSRFHSNGNVSIGTTSDIGIRLDVNGTFRYSYSDTALVNGQYGSVQAVTYTPSTNTSNRNLYNTRSNLEFNLTSGALLGDQSYNVAADFSQVVVYGNAATASTQPIRAYLVGLVGGAGQAAMNLSDFRFLDIKSPDGAGVSGHQVGTMYGLRIGSMIGTSNFNITTAYGIYQAGASDQNFFAGKIIANSALEMSESANMVFGTTTGSKIGTSNLQKIGFWNATPVAQPNTTIASATVVLNTGNDINDASTFDGYTLAQVVKALRNIGILN